MLHSFVHSKVNFIGMGVGEKCRIFLSYIGFFRLNVTAPQDDQAQCTAQDDY